MLILVSSIVQVESQLFLRRLIDNYIAPLISMDTPIYTDLIKFTRTR